MTDRSRLRLFVLRVLVVSLLVTLVGRLWYLQVLAGPVYQRAASVNQVRSVVEPAARGAILDDVGRPLVRNRTALVVSVDRTALMRQRDGGTAVLHRLGTLLRIPYEDLHQRIQLCGPQVQPPCWNGSPYQPVPVTDRANTTQALQIEERAEDFPGVTAELAAVRDYPGPAAANAAQVLGYLAPISDGQLANIPVADRDAHRDDLVGAAGLEQTYDTYLAGAPGVRQVSVDHLGGVVGTLDEAPPRPGDDLVTSLDAVVQHDLEGTLSYAMRLAHTQGKPADSAAGVVLDAQTGRVVAMASLPTYQPDIFVGGISQKDYARLTNSRSGTPLLNRAADGEYSPGSTFKLISTAGVLNEGRASFSGVYPCPPALKVGDRVFKNFEGESFGNIDLHTTIVKSCDTVYYGFALADWQRDNALAAAHRTPVEGVQHMARNFGLGTKTGIDLPAEASGLIEDRALKYQQWKQFYGPNACKGARNPKFDAQRRAFDADVCRYGYLFLPGDQANMDIGQGSVLVTPLQLAVAYAALVNGGKVFSPRIAKAVVAPDGHVVRPVTAPVSRRLPVPQAYLNQIMAAMYDVTKTGTAQAAFTGFPFNRIAVGGKTGTAEVLANGTNDTSWFASFAGPRGHPARFVSVIAVPKAGQGGLVAAPATRHLWEQVFGLAPHTRPAFRGLLPPTALPKLVPAGVRVVPAQPASTPSSPLGLGAPAAVVDERRMRGVR